MRRYRWENRPSSEQVSALVAAPVLPILHPEIRDVFELEAADGRRLRIEAHKNRFLYSIGTPIAEAA